MINPYESPTADLHEAIPVAPGELRVFARGDKLWVPTGAELPLRCCECNALAKRRYKIIATGERNKKVRDAWTALTAVSCLLLLLPVVMINYYEVEIPGVYSKYLSDFSFVVVLAAIFGGQLLERTRYIGGPRVGHCSRHAGIHSRWYQSSWLIVFIAIIVVLPRFTEHLERDLPMLFDYRYQAGGLLLLGVISYWLVRARAKATAEEAPEGFWLQRCGAKYLATFPQEEGPATSE